MKGVVQQQTAKLPGAVKRLAGNTAILVEGGRLNISSWLSATVWDVFSSAATELPEDHGRFVLLPLEDDQYSVQLLYIRQSGAADVAADIVCLDFHPQFFAQWPAAMLAAEKAFRPGQSSEVQFNLCAQTRLMLEQLLQDNQHNDFAAALKQTELAMQLLRRAIDSLNVPFTACQVPACRFLAYDSEREKIFKARQIIDQQFDRQITIKELSRKVAMNECYLKKGFKALVGKTIHEYQQAQRITHARQMLQTGHSVTNVADLLGYSSISHFSTAFKKATGLKPCELLK